VLWCRLIKIPTVRDVIDRISPSLLSFFLSFSALQLSESHPPSLSPPLQPPRLRPSQVEAAVDHTGPHGWSQVRFVLLLAQIGFVSSCEFFFSFAILLCINSLVKTLNNVMS